MIGLAPSIAYCSLQKDDWHELNFSIFATGNNMLHNHYRCFGNPRDKIHLGFNGIRELEHLIVRQISRVDNRSYSTVTKSNIS